MWIYKKNFFSDSYSFLLDQKISGTYFTKLIHFGIFKVHITQVNLKKVRKGMVIFVHIISNWRLPTILQSILSSGWRESVLNVFNVTTEVQIPQKKAQKDIWRANNFVQNNPSITYNPKKFIWTNKRLPTCLSKKIAIRFFKQY